METPKKSRKLHPLQVHFGLTLEDLDRIEREEELEKKYPKRARPEYVPIRRQEQLSPLQEEVGFTLEEVNQILEREYQQWLRTQKRK